MKSTRLIIIILIVLLLAVLLFRLKKNPSETPSLLPTETNVSAEQLAGTKPLLAKNVISVDTNTQINAATASNISTSPTDPKENNMREDLAHLNDMDIYLNGQVIDQFGSPVSDATVSGIVQVNSGMRVGTDRMSITTDANGFFTISGYKGKNLGIHVVKNGYVMAATNTSFTYSYLWPESQRFTPDPNNPVVIKMWKLQGAEPLVAIDKEYKLPFTAAPIYFDLVAGKIVPTGGDFRITVNRPDGIISQQHPQNWSIQIEVIDGGLIETSGKEAAIAFAAPESGYQPGGTFGNDNGSDVTHRAFFIQSRNGKVYSKLGISFRINNTPSDFMYITFRGVANTNNSRNWEATAPQQN